MRHSAPPIYRPRVPAADDQLSQPSLDARLLALADACFEMFSMKELRKPWSILHELSGAFPDLSRPQIFRAVRMALSWRRILKEAGEPIH